MGTNFYLYEERCPECGHQDRLHIGKSSIGWCFSLHVMPHAGINDLIDWIRLFLVEGRYIENQFGELIETADMLERIMCRESYALTGKELRRHDIDGFHCIGHGEGTWDLIQGEFS